MIPQLLDARSETIERLGVMLQSVAKGTAIQDEKFYHCFSVNFSSFSQHHHAKGFTPREESGNALFDPLELLKRATYFWQQTRWPGHKGRSHFLHTLFNVQILQLITYASISATNSSDLHWLQTLLDQLWELSPEDQPCLVRDVRWLPAIALSPTTNGLKPYFYAAERFATSFNSEDLLTIHRAWSLTGAGHLCTQLKSLCEKRDVDLGDTDLLLLTRLSNSLDLSLITEGLTLLLLKYLELEHDETDQGQNERLSFAKDILIALAPDPRLFLQDMNLLTPYTWVETTHGKYGTNEKPTALGERQLSLCKLYTQLMQKAHTQLLADAELLNKADLTFSPLGVLFGCSSNLIELMAFKTLTYGSEKSFSLEDIFISASQATAKAKKNWVSQWRQFPHVPSEISKRYEYSSDWAIQLQLRVLNELRIFVNPTEIGNFTVSYNHNTDATIKKVPLMYLETSLPSLVERGANWCSREDLSFCRDEGEYLFTEEVEGHLIALRKDVITQELGNGTSLTLDFHDLMLT